LGLIRLTTDEANKGKRPRHSFTDEFKAGAVSLVLDRGKTVAQLARDLETASALGQWVEQARADAGKSSRGTLTSHAPNAFEISDVRGDYLRVCDFRRFAGTPLRLLVTGFVVLPASNKCRMPCSNSSTALAKAPSCPTRTIATDKCNSNDGGRNT